MVVLFSFFPSFSFSGQAGTSLALQARFNETSLNPVLLDTAGTMLIMTQLPWFEQLEPSVGYLDRIWPKLRASLSKFAPAAAEAAEVDAVCAAGAAGDHPAALRCFSVWQTELIPRFQRQIDKVRDVLDEVLPNVDPVTDAPFSGAYWSETDYFERDYSGSYWGAAHYARLLKIKAKYDPAGLFICHHCVGSEFWTAASSLNCRNTSLAYPPS